MPTAPHWNKIPGSNPTVGKECKECIRCGSICGEHTSPRVAIYKGGKWCLCSDCFDDDEEE